MSTAKHNLEQWERALNAVLDAYNPLPGVDVDAITVLSLPLSAALEYLATITLNGTVPATEDWTQGLNDLLDAWRNLHAIEVEWLRDRFPELTDALENLNKAATEVWL